MPKRGDERDATDVWEEPSDDDVERREPHIAALIDNHEGLPAGGDTLDHLVDAVEEADDEDGD